MIIDKKFSTKHEHLVEYLENSLTYGHHPLPISEKSDTYHYGVKTTVRMFWEAGAFVFITSVDNEVHLKAVLPDDITYTWMIDSYNPDSIINNYWKERQV